MFNSFKKPLAIYAHPDDEVIGASCALEYYGADVQLAFVTDGAPTLEDAPEYYHPNTPWQFGSEYIDLRRSEARDVGRILGVQNEVQFLGLTDSSLHLETVNLLQMLRKLIVGTMPDLILTHAYEGGHLDHDLVSAAVWKIINEAKMAVSVCETPLYSIQKGQMTHNQKFARHDGWPTFTALPSEAKGKAMSRYLSQQIDLKYFDPKVMEYYHFRTDPDLSTFRELPNGGETTYDTGMQKFIYQLLQA